MAETPKEKAERQKKESEAYRRKSEQLQKDFGKRKAAELAKQAERRRQLRDE